MSEECVVAVYSSFGNAKVAIQALDNAGFPHDSVSFVTYSVEDEVPEREEEAMQLGDEAERSAAKGAGMGGLVGLLLGSPLIAVPGIGPVLIAGPIAAGAVVGGLVGAMSGWGIHTDHVRKYERKIAEGSYLVVVNGDPRRVADAEELLQKTDPDELHLHAETSADTVDL